MMLLKNVCSIVSMQEMNDAFNEDECVKNIYRIVLEEKIVFGDDLVLSIATEFVENEKENATKQDCKMKSFKRLAETLKKMFPGLPICLLGDSLYSCTSIHR